MSETAINFRAFAHILNNFVKACSFTYDAYAKDFDEYFLLVNSDSEVVAFARAFINRLVEHDGAKFSSKEERIEYESYLMDWTINNIVLASSEDDDSQSDAELAYAVLAKYINGTVARILREQQVRTVDLDEIEDAFDIF